MEPNQEPTGWPPVTLIVLNWNGRRYLADCLPSLLAQDYPHFSLVVVDNGSTDGSVGFIGEHFPQVVVRALPRNVGFAAGNNVALRRLASELAVLVNPDVIAPPEWLRNLVQPFQTDAQVGIAGCLVVYGDGRTIQHAGGIIHPPRAVPSYIGLGETDEGQYDAPREVDYVVGAAMAIRGELLAQIGLLDEGYFLYYEDPDYCIRARRAGYGVVYTPGARLVHLESVLTRKDSPAYLRWMHSGRWRFLLKHVEPATILAETQPAEEAWLAQCAPAEREAAAHAYHSALRRREEIWQARVRDGGTVVPPQMQAALAEALRSLLRAAEQVAPVALPPHLGAARLAAAAELREQPFRSRLLVVGRLVAACRALWNAVASRAYVRPLLAQQNRFNNTVARQLAHYEQALDDQGNALAALAPHIVEQQLDAAEWPSSLAQLRQEVTAAYQRLEVIERRLAEWSEISKQ